MRLGGPSVPGGCGSGGAVTTGVRGEGDGVAELVADCPLGGKLGVGAVERGVDGVDLGAGVLALLLGGEHDDADDEGEDEHVTGFLCGARVTATRGGVVDGRGWRAVEVVVRGYVHADGGTGAREGAAERAL